MPRTTARHQWQSPSRSPLRLTDSGTLTVQARQLGLHGREGGWTTFGESFLAANSAALHSLDVSAHFDLASADLRLRLRAGGRVGAVPLRSPITQKVIGGIVVEPRFGWSGIGRVLEAVGWSAAPEVLHFPLVPGSARDVPPWVLAGPILHAFADLLGKTTRGFRAAEQTREMPRGRIDWKRYCNRQIPRGQLHRLPCIFPVLGPDQTLLSFVHWGLQCVLRSLLPYVMTDPIARRLSAFGESLAALVKDFPTRQPSHSQLDSLLRGSGLPSEALRNGVQCLGWLVDERGLAGLNQTDGLAWRLAMHDLFEAWVGTLARTWGASFGGAVRAGREGHVRIPIHWETTGAGSLKELVPDIVVEAGDTVVIIDAKYKAHFEEMDDARWREIAEEIQEEHRRDLHQILAYCAAYDAPRVVAKLVYPMHPATWRRLKEQRRSVTRAIIPGHGRQVELRLAGVPLLLDTPYLCQEIVEAWGPLR